MCRTEYVNKNVTSRDLKKIPAVAAFVHKNIVCDLVYTAYFAVGLSSVLTKRGSGVFSARTADFQATVQINL